MDNEQGYAEAYKDVIHEAAIKIGGATKAPDYCFRIGGTRKFFLEAKKPAVNIKDDPEPAFQLRRYAWSAKLPLSILTNFEEFAVYDCRVKPAQTDKASAARILYLRCDEYAAAGTRRSPASSPARPSSKAPSTSSPSPKRPSAARPPWTPPSSTRSRSGATSWPATWPCATRTSPSAS